MKITARISAGRCIETLTTYSDVQLVGTQYPNVYLKTAGQLVQPILETVQSTGVSTTDITEVEGGDLPITSTVTDPVFFFCYNLTNYFHFLYDAVPTLAQFLRMHGRRVYILVPKGARYRFVTETLSLLGIRDILEADENTLYKQVIVASSPTHEGVSNDPPHSSVWDVYSHLRTIVGAPVSSMPKKIYISRRSWIHGDTSNLGTNYTTRRRMLCEDELVAALEAKGYTEVFCETMTMLEKIRLFSHVTHVVGAIGGGMCNLVFSPPETKVLCIGSPDFERINHRFLYTMNHTQLTMFRDTQSTSILYRRAKAGDLIGEVVEDQGDQVVLALGDGVTWKDGETSSILVADKEKVVFLDEGLNSPWTFDVTECVNLIQ